MTTKERALKAIQALPDDATINDAIEQLRRVMDTLDQSTGVPGGAEREDGDASVVAPVDVWALLNDLTGKLSAPQDWAAGHDHYLYGKPKRDSAA